jgi:hypothetical protein
MLLEGELGVLVQLFAQRNQLRRQACSDRANALV